MLAAVLHVLVIHSIGAVLYDVRKKRRCKEKDDMLQISANAEDNNIR